MGFLAMGIFWGSWSALIPSVQQATAANDAELGRALLFVSVGAVPAMIFGGRLVDRYGARLLLPSILLFGLAAILPVLAPSPFWLGAALLIVGAASGFMDVIMNARVSAAETVYGRHFMNACHGSFSATFFVSAITTGALRGYGFAAMPILSGMMVLMVGLAIVGSLIGKSSPAIPVSKTEHQSGGVLLSFAVLALGIVVFCAFLAENGLQAWSAIHLERTLNGSPEIGAFGPAILGLAFAIGRFGGQAAQHRLRLDRLVGLGALISVTAVTGFAYASNVPLALASIFIAGLGVSVIGPSAIGAVGQLVPEEMRGRAVAAVTTIAYTGFFVGPALLGFIAQSYGLRAAITTIAGFCLLLLPVWIVVIGPKPRASSAD
ncbi:MFS transporter [Sinorhizobium medicae]